MLFPSVGLGLYLSIAASWATDFPKVDCRKITVKRALMPNAAAPTWELLVFDGQNTVRLGTPNELVDFLNISDRKKAASTALPLIQSGHARRANGMPLTESEWPALVDTILETYREGDTNIALLWLDADSIFGPEHGGGLIRVRLSGDEAKANAERIHIRGGPEPIVRWLDIDRWKYEGSLRQSMDDMKGIHLSWFLGLLQGIQLNTSRYPKGFHGQLHPLSIRVDEKTKKVILLEPHPPENRPVISAYNPTARTGERADVMAIGIMLYDVLTGGLPIFMDDAVALNRKARLLGKRFPIIPYRKAAERNAKTPAPLEAIIEKCLTDEFYSSAQLQKDLTEFIRSF